MINFFKLKNNTRGFSLVEMLVAVAIFGTLATIIGNTFTQMLGLQRKGGAAQLVQENVTFALDLMAREIRVGTLAAQDSDCSSGLVDSTLVIQHPVNGTVNYALTGTVIQRTAGGITTNLTADSVVVTRLNFCVLGSADDNQQARVGILIGIQDPRARTTFNIQTTVSSRELNTDL